MAHLIYMMQVSTNKEFTSVFYTKLFKTKGAAIRGYNFNKTISEANKLGNYIRLLEIDMSLGIGTATEEETIKQNFK